MKITIPLTAVFLIQVLSSAAFAQQSASTREVPAPVATTGTIAGGNAVVTADYRLLPGDKLNIDVHEDKSLSQSLQIRPDGKITLPLVGDLPAAGRTPMELRVAIAKALKAYIADPTVTVIVQQTAPQLVYVMGEVAKPGPQEVSGPLTVMQALATAGGFTDFANRKDIRILRKSAGGTRTLHFNYKEALDEGSVGPTLLPGDTVIVK